MKTILFTLTILLLSETLCSCSSIVARTKYTDVAMRIMVDPEHISSGSYVQIQTALVTSGKWFVVDRGAGMAAVLKEQERLHRAMPDRFSNKEKYAMWGKMYGVGGIVVPTSKCIIRNGSFGRYYQRCFEVLQLVNANTGEVIAAADDMVDDYDGVPSPSIGGMAAAPSWDTCVDKLNENFPAKFEGLKYEEPQLTFRAVVEEESLRQEELVLRKKLLDERMKSSVSEE